MAGSVFDSQIFSDLFPTGEIGRLFTDMAEIRAMMFVQGNLAKIQGKQGVIPEVSAQAIHRAAIDLQLDPSELSQATGQNGVSVPGLIDAFEKHMQAPEHSQYIHFGATSQDIIDSGLMLRLRQMLNLQEQVLQTLLRRLAKLAQEYTDLPMVARTYGQDAALTSFGATVATWGNPLFDLFNSLPDLRKTSLWVSLSGAAGTSAALGKDAHLARAGLAESLRLGNPERSWHSDRSPILRIVNWQAALSAALGKMAEDILILRQSNIKTVILGQSGASSTMPQKQNPVGPSAISSLSRYVIGQQSVLQQAALHKEARDGAAWFTEWLALPQLCLSASSALLTANDMCGAIMPDKAAMQSDIARSRGMIYAEALSFELAKSKPRPEATADIKELCMSLQNSNDDFVDTAKRKWPELANFNPVDQLGEAPQFALSFAERVKEAF